MTTVESDVPQFVDLVSSLSNESKQVYETSTSQLKPPAASSSAAESEQFIPLQSALLMSYTQHLLAISSHRMLGLSLEKDSKGRELVRNLVRMRLQLEKMRPVEARLKPKWERWVRAYEAEEKRRIERGDSDKDASADEKDDEIGKSQPSAVCIGLLCAKPPLHLLVQIHWPLGPIQPPCWIHLRLVETLSKARRRNLPQAGGQTKTTTTMTMKPLREYTDRLNWPPCRTLAIVLAADVLKMYRTLGQTMTELAAVLREARTRISSQIYLPPCPTTRTPKLRAVWPQAQDRRAAPSVRNDCERWKSMKRQTSRVWYNRRRSRESAGETRKMSLWEELRLLALGAERFPVDLRRSSAIC